VAETALKMPVTAPVPVINARTVSADSYPNLRDNFFTDRDNKYRLYFLPDAGGLGGTASRALLARFRAAGISGAGIEMPKSYPWGIPVIVLLVICVFTAFAKFHLVMLAGALPLLAFSIGIPQYPAGIGICQCLFSLFLLQKNWLRRGFVHQWLNLWYGPAFVAAAFAVCAFFSIQCVLYFMAGAAGSASALFLAASLPRRKGFIPVKILPAARIPALTPRSIASAGISCGGVLLLSVFFVFQTAILSANSQKGLYFPAPSRYTHFEGFTVPGFVELRTLRIGGDAELPDLGQFIGWVWETLTFPFYSLNAPDIRRDPEPGTEVSIPVYTQTGSGIVQSSSAVHVFDNGFIAGTLEALAASGDDSAESIENVLAAQGRFVSVAYTALETPRQQRDFLIFILLLAAAAAFLMTALIFMVGWRMNERRN
jgi:hypothetical protein